MDDIDIEQYYDNIIYTQQNDQNNQTIMIANNRSDNAHEHTYHKMDNLFYSAIQRTISNYRFKLTIHMIKLILILIFLPIDLFQLKTQHSIIIMFMWMSIFIVGFNLSAVFSALYYAYSNKYENNIYFLQYATETGHSVQQQPITSRERLNNLQQCASQIIYNAETGAINQQEGLTPAIRSKYQSVYSGYIESKIFKKYIWIQFFQMSGKLASVVLFGFGIFSLCVDSPSSHEKGVLISFLILQAMNIWMFIVVVMLLALSPIICLIMCFMVFCCVDIRRVQGDHHNTQFTLPQQVQVTNQIIAQCDGSCPICFQTFVLFEKVIVLPCSKKHVFHKSCLQTWARVSKTCPVCRRNMDGTR